MFVTFIALTIALAIGWQINARLQVNANDKMLVVGLDALVSPLLALTTLLLAFVLVQVFSSHNRAKLSAGEEAGQVLAEFRLFSYLNDKHSAVGQANLLCYARSVINLEWPAMAESNLAITPEVTHWGLQLDVVLTDLASSSTSPVFGALVAADRGRTDARRRRAAETGPAVPKPVTWLMLGVSAIAILFISSLTRPTVVGVIKVGALISLTLVFATTQWAILEIDSKYDGRIRVDPDEMILLSGVLEQQFKYKHHAYPMPCDIFGGRLESN